MGFLSNLPHFYLNREIQDPIRIFEDSLATSGEAYFLLDRSDLSVEAVRRYLILTSLPFMFREDQTSRTDTVEESLSKLWDPGLKKCKQCPTVVRRLTMPTGNLNPKIMVVAEAPGVGDGKKAGFDRVLVYGPTSYLLRQSMVDAGIYFDSWFTNLLKCALPGNRGGFLEEYENCAPKLAKEFNILKPERVILFGSRVQSFFKAYGMKCRNRKIEKDLSGVFNGASVISLPHPTSYIYRGARGELKDDLRLAIGGVKLG
jgi:DNA polymerase